MEKVGIVAFAFGVPHTIKANRHIAKIASKKALEFHAQVYTQSDISIDALGFDIEVTYAKEEFGNSPPTLRIARGAVQWAIQNRLRGLWVVAAEPHLIRALRDLRRAADEAGVGQIDIRTCREVFDYIKDFWFCPDSIQERTRSHKTWNKRERILRLLPFFIYKRIAS